jgi:hypothetical protein
MNVICLVVDRLHAAYLGAYGNTWIRTPAIDRLAADGFVFDQMVTDSPRLESLGRSYWMGRHAMGPADGEPDAATLPTLFDQAGMASVLLSDEPAVLRHPLAVDFDEQVAIEPRWQPQVAESLDETHLGQCFAQLFSVLEQMPSGFLLWTHFSSLGTTWDAPIELREMHRDEGDPPPFDAAEVPEIELGEDFDPDHLLPIVQAYAGQVTLFDACLAGLMELLDQSQLGQDTALLLTAPRGVPLGEHRLVGTPTADGRADPLYGEVIQVPLIVRLPDASGGVVGRSQALVQPADVFATVAELCHGGEHGLNAIHGRSLLPIIRGEATAWRERAAVLGHRSQRGFRTPAWYLRLTDRPELFVKPDDRWEANDVAPRCREVVEAMLDELNNYAELAQSAQPGEMPPLPDLLREGLE